MFGAVSSARRRLRLGALACAISMVAVVGSASASTLPPQGIFENCSLDTQMTTCIQRLTVMHQGGLQVAVISATEGSPASLQTYATAARIVGMSVMWELSDPRWWQDPSTSTSMATTYPGFATACGCNQNGALLAYVVRWLGALPATYGYYAADDSVLAPGDQGNVAGYVAEIKQQDPVHTVMIGSADESQTATYQGIADVIGNDIYPVTDSSLMPVSANQDTWDEVGQEASDDQQTADRAGKQSAFILQAFTWGDNLSDGQTIGGCSATDTQASCYGRLRYPSPGDQLELRNEMLLHAHPTLILWWSFPGTYGDVTGNTYSIYPTGAEATARWNGLAAAVQAPFPSTASPSTTSPSTTPPSTAPANRATRHHQPARGAANPARAHIALVDPRLHRVQRRNHRRHHHLKHRHLRQA